MRDIAPVSKESASSSWSLANLDTPVAMETKELTPDSTRESNLKTELSSLKSVAAARLVANTEV